MNQYDHLKDTLLKYRVPIDKEKMWKQTSHAIRQRKRRRTLLFFLAGMIGVASIWLTLLQPDDAYQSMPVTYVIPENAPLQTNTSQKDSPAHVEDLHAISSDKTARPQNSNPSIRQINEDDPSLSGHKQTLRPSVEKEHKDITKPRQTTSQTVHPDSPPKVITQSVAIQITDDMIERDDAKAEDPGLSPGIALNDDIENRDQLDNVIDANIHATQDEELTNSFKNNELNVVDRMLRPVILPVLPLSSKKEISMVTPDEKTADEDWMKNGIPVISAAKKRNAVSIAMLTAIGISSFEIKALNAASTETAAMLRQQVKSLEHISVEVNGGLPVSNIFSIETGVALNRWTTKTTQQSSTQTPVSRQDVVSVRIDENGTAVPVHGLVQGLQVSTVHRTRFTQYNTMDVAVSLRAAVWRNMRLQGDVTGFAAFNVLDEVSGSTLNEEGDIWKFSSAENPFVRKSKWSAGIRMQLKYHVTPHLSLGSTLGYTPVKYILHQDQQKTEWTHSLLRGNIGLQYQL